MEQPPWLMKHLAWVWVSGIQKEKEKAGSDLGWDTAETTAFSLGDTKLSSSFEMMSTVLGSLKISNFDYSKLHTGLAYGLCEVVTY